mgnify:CR=1 FL=1
MLFSLTLPSHSKASVLPVLCNKNGGEVFILGQAYELLSKLVIILLILFLKIVLLSLTFIDSDVGPAMLEFKVDIEEEYCSIKSAL